MEKSPKNRKNKNEYDTVSQSSENIEDWEKGHSAKSLKQVSKRKYHIRHFPNLNNETVLKRYSCALVNEFLRQGYLYVTDNYFAFYSNIFGYVTKLLIPIISIEDITKEKTAKIIPNAIGIITGEQKHIFSSFIQRESSFIYLKKVWQDAKNGDVSADDFDSASSYTTEEELPENEVVVGDHVDKQGSSVSKIIKTTGRKSRLYNFLWYSIIFSTIFLFSMAGILWYKIVMLRNKFSWILAEDGSFKMDQVLEKLSRELPELYENPQSSIYKFVDKNIHMVTDVRNSLESLYRVLDIDNKIKKT